MNLEYIESINTAGQRLEITKSNRPDKLIIKTFKNGVTRESYRAMTKEEVIQIVGAALTEGRS